MSNLYELTNELMDLQNMLELELEDEDVLNDTIEGISGEYEDKLENYCKVIKNIEGDITAIKAEVERLTNKRKVLEKNIDRLKKAMFDSMKATDTTKVKGNIFTIAIQKNGGKTPINYDRDDLYITNDLPDDLVVVSEKPNLDAIREKLEAGQEVKGFTLGCRGESLRIK